MSQRLAAGEWRERIGRWLASAIAWGPLLIWVLWPRLDARLAWSPMVGYSSTIALLIVWVYTAQRFPPRSNGPTLVAVGVAFNVSFAVAARTDDVGTFAAISLVMGSLVAGAASGLVVVVGVRLARIGDYGTLEDVLLLTVPLVQGATLAGITAGSISTDRRHLLLGIFGGLMAGVILSTFCLGWIYGIIGLVSSYLARHSRESLSTYQVDRT